MSSKKRASKKGNPSKLTAYNQVGKRMVEEKVFVPSKTTRKLIDKDPKVVQYTKLDKKYIQKFKQLAADIEIAARREGAESQKRITVGAGVFQIKTAKRLIDTIAAGEKGRKATGEKPDRQFANFRQQNSFFRRAMPEMVENKQLGHQNISVLRGNIAAALSEFGPDFEHRKRLLALYAIVVEIDKINEEGVDMDDLLDKLRKFASRRRNFKTSYEKDVSILSGLSGRIELIYEDLFVNTEVKGVMSSIIGGYFKEIIDGETKNVDAFLGDIPIERLQGSGTIIDDILALTADTIDPKKKFTRRKSKGTKKSSSGSSGYKKDRKAKLTAPQIERLENRPRANTQQRRDLSPLALVTLINNKLPDVVAKNMVPPRLQLRTGRLAQSARVIDVQQTRQGFPSIGYTYEKDPYQVFEVSSGTRFSDRERDPRNLIDASVREIAATLFTGRLFTRRI